MSRPIRILFLEDNRVDVELAERELRNLGMKYILKHVEDEAGFRKALKEFVPDLILSDYTLPQFNGMEALQIAKMQAPHIPFIIVTGSINEETAVSCIKAGAIDYVLKAHLPRLVISVKEALELKKSKEEKRKTEMELEKYRNHLEELVEKRTDELKQSEESMRFQAEIVQNMVEGVHLTRVRDGIIVYTNPKFEQMFGYGPNGLIGKHISIVCAPGERSSGEAAEEVIKVLNETGRWSGEVHNVKKDGTAFWCYDQVSTFHHSKYGDVWVSIHEDITERKRLQEELIRKDKLALLGQLAGGVAHELRNPLGTIKNAAYFLNMSLEKPDKEVKEILKVFDEEITTASDTIDTLLDFARPDIPTRIEVDVNNAVQKALSRIKVPENIEVITQLDRTVPAIQADPDQIERAFENVALNAIQAMPEGGRLTIKSKSISSKQILVSFKDNGVGIGKNELGRLFEPLFTTKAKGIGLGLALTRLFIQRNGGTIEVQSKENEGSTFTIKLPVAAKK